MATGAKNASQGVSQEQIVSGFNDLRQQQRAMGSKVSELEMERKEHALVIETLKGVDKDRKCFRMVGGVLVERTVKEILPALDTNSTQLGKLIESLSKQLVTKGKEIVDYKKKHKIQVRGEESNKVQSQDTEAKKVPSQGVLVDKDS